MALFINELHRDGMSVDVDGMEERRVCHVNECNMNR